jgi:hypothetical protein
VEDTKRVVPVSVITFVLVVPFALLVVVTVPAADPDFVGADTIPIWQEPPGATACEVEQSVPPLGTWANWPET